MKVIIYGNGAMAKVLYSYMKINTEVIAFTVDEECIESQNFCGLPLIPFDKIDKIYSPEYYQMINSIGFIEMNELREKKYYEAKQKGYKFTNYIHESLIQHDDVIIEENCIIYESVSIHPGSIIKKGTFISSNVSIGHDTQIGEFNWINSGVSIAGSCKIGKNCFFGVNSSLANNISIGTSNFISANTLVNSNTKDNEVFLSEPGQPIKISSKNFLNFSKLG